MTNFTPEMIEKAKTAKSAEELLALAKENSIELTEEEAKTYFEQLKPKCGELSEDELNKVSAGFDPTFTSSPALIGSKEQYCPHCNKDTVFYIPMQGPEYCSVCNKVYEVPVTEGDFIIA